MGDWEKCVLHRSLETFDGKALKVWWEGITVLVLLVYWYCWYEACIFTRKTEN